MTTNTNGDSVPNGTELRSINEPVVDFVNSYRTFSKAGAESIIDQCETVVRAKDVLSDKPFKYFLLEIDLKEQSSTYRKIRAIGKAASRFKAIIDKMPNEWTTLYMLASLDQEIFTGLVESDVITPNVTAKAIKEALGRIEKATEDFKITINLDGCTLGQQYEIVKSVRANVAVFSASAKYSKALESRLEGYDEQLMDLPGVASVEA
jgi:hypothetical protein